MRLALITATFVLASPAFAQETADGDWACTTLIGFEPVAYLALSGASYVLTRPDGPQGKGTIEYSDSPILTFYVLSGDLLDDFDVNEATGLGGDRLIFNSTDGGIGLMCEPGKPEKS